MNDHKTTQEIFSVWKNQIDMSPSSIFSKQDVMNILDSVAKALDLTEGTVVDNTPLISVTSEAIDNFRIELVTCLAELQDEGKYHDELLNFSEAVYNVEPGNVITIKDGVLIDSEKFDTFLDTVKERCFTKNDE